MSDRMLERAEMLALENPGLLATHLRRLTNMPQDARAVAQHLGLEWESYLLLALCRMPRVASWREDLSEISQATGIALPTLATILSELGALLAMDAGSQSSMLLAARRDYRQSGAGNSEGEDDSDPDPEP